MIKTEKVTVAQVVIPAKAGIQVSNKKFNSRFTAWIPAFAGMTVASQLSLRMTAFAAAFFLSGCVTREDIRGIQTDLYTIQQGINTRIGSVKDQTDSVQTSQADLLHSIQDLSGNLTVLQADLNDYQQRMQQLSVRLDDLEASLTARMDSQIELLSGSKFVEKPLPSTAFNLANTDFVRGRYSEAVSGFQNYIKLFAKSAKVVEAKLKIGDALAKQKDLDGAAAAYAELAKDYPKDPLAPTALLRKADVLTTMGRKSQAKDAYMEIIKSYSTSNESKAAQDRLRAMQAENSSKQP